MRGWCWKTTIEGKINHRNSRTYWPSSIVDEIQHFFTGCVEICRKVYEVTYQAGAFIIHVKIILFVYDKGSL